MASACPALTFCEGVGASGSSPWHLRWRMGEEKKIGGGIHSDSLCGAVKAHHGWDLSAEPHRHGLEHSYICTSCRKAYEEWVATV
jgi:hypothetical protein